MISNYIKLAIRGMGRNKFFSAISLFGISFTLAILMLIVSVLETEIGSTKPLTQKDKMVVLPNLQMKKVFYDTIYVFDTLIQQEMEIIDTSFTTEESGQNNTNNQFARWYLDRHFSELPNAENYTFFNANNVFNSYVQNSKVAINAQYVDHRYWQIFDYVFVEGKGFGPESVDQEERICVITTDLADKYFGRKENVLGELIEMDGNQLKVTGMVKPAGVSLLSADLMLPHTLITNVGRRDEAGFGGFMGVLLAKSAAQTKAIKDDVDIVESKLEVPSSMVDNYEEVEVVAFDYYEVYSMSLLDTDEPEDALKYMKWILFGLLGFFILLPTLNLINLNVSRMLERSSEIGVRKAFGASRSVILWQFIVENIIQTLLGGILGFLLAMVLIYLLNDARLMGDIILKINYRFFIYSFIICLLFGIVSGFLPAFRMSKIHVVDALKQYKL